MISFFHISLMNVEFRSPDSLDFFSPCSAAETEFEPLALDVWGFIGVSIPVDHFCSTYIRG